MKTQLQLYRFCILDYIKWLLYINECSRHENLVMVYHSSQELSELHNCAKDPKGNKVNVLTKAVETCRNKRIKKYLRVHLVEKI